MICVIQPIFFFLDMLQQVLPVSDLKAQAAQVECKQKDCNIVSAVKTLENLI